ncbi:MAG: tRNA (adenosine(37)-N6)-dimethylallyltransferase MiaA [Alphaproteobacteria bacterium]
MSSIHIVAGPTASGKSAYALDLAVKKNGVIVNCDSLQIYDGLPILTAQPGVDDKDAAPHELYGVLPPGKTCSAGTWREMVGPVIDKILRKGKTPVITGGTGLYIKALTDGLSPIPDIPDDVRAAARDMHARLGNPDFYEELKKRDPLMAARLAPGNTVRLIRAWEVIEHTGRSLADWQQEARLAPPPGWNFKIHKIMPEREELNARCDRRFEMMMDRGVLDEVAAFDEAIERTAMPADAPLTRALGFKALRAYLRGEISREEAVGRGQTQTRQYAKRQLTWFRHQL